MLLLDGAVPPGRWLDLDLTVHIALRRDALVHAPHDAWTVTACAGYADEVGSEGPPTSCSAWTTSVTRASSWSADGGVLSPPSVLLRSGRRVRQQHEHRFA